MERMLQREKQSEKYGMLDIEVTLSDGRKIDIKMQRFDEVNHIKRTVYYASKLISEQLQQGDTYDKLRPVEIIYITDFNFLRSEYYKTSTVIVDELDRRNVIVEELRFHYIELPKFRKSKPDMKEKLNQWLAFIDDQNKEWMNMAKELNKSIKKAMDEFDRLVANEAEKYSEEGKERFLKDMASVKYNTFNKGLEDGIKQGIKQGIEQGIKQEKIDTVKQMIKMNIDEETIMKITGLSREEIISLK